MSGDGSILDRSAAMSRRSSLSRSRSDAIEQWLLSRRRLMAGGASLGGAMLMAGAGWMTVSGQSATPEAGHDEHADMGSGL